MTKLSRTTLAALPPGIATPSYPSPIATPIVHFGVGGFHRSHEAMYIDRLLEQGSTTGGICGVGVLEADRAMRDVLSEQDNLYTLVTTSPDGDSSARVIGSIAQYLFAPDDPDAVVRKLAEAGTRIVSLSITEGGYGVDDSTGLFDPKDESTLADLAGARPPRSVLGMIVEGLKRRREASLAPFTVMSCDNIQGNGHVARRAVVGFAARHDADLAQWIADEVSFPSSMVDRITPVTTDETRADVTAQFGVDDAWPVRAESFEQWVLEDRFTFGRPPLETVGVQLVEDVEPYELMKLRLLNASHQAMSYLGILSGANYVHEVCSDPLFVDFLFGYMREEAIPTLRPVPGVDVDAYCEDLMARFASEAIRDTLARQVVDASARIPKFLLPVVHALRASEADFGRCALVLAAWSVFLCTDEERGPRLAVDVRRDELTRAAAADQRDPGAFLDVVSVFGDLGSDPVVREKYVSVRVALGAYGAREVVRRINRGEAL